MKIKKRVQFFLLIFLLILCTWNLIMDVPEQKQENYNISIVIRGKMDESWSNLKKGAESAAEDLNVNLRFVAAIDGNSAEEQIELLKQEAVGTDAILVSPVNRVLLKESIKELEQELPLILIESNILGDHDIPIIQSDNEAMGISLAEEVIRHGMKEKKIVVLNGNEISSNVIERQRGFLKYMEEIGADCTVANIGSLDPEEICKSMKERTPDVLVAFDTGILENLVKANGIYKSEFPEASVRLYGVGCSSTLLKALENKEIAALTASDSFSIGYLAVQEAVKAIEHKKPQSNETIRYIVTDSEHMYDDTHQALLFPFVK